MATKSVRKSTQSSDARENPMTKDEIATAVAKKKAKKSKKSKRG